MLQPTATRMQGSGSCSQHSQQIAEAKLLLRQPLLPLLLLLLLLCAFLLAAAAANA
jgi:hypothetical protein